jgi:hypothetical protein
LNTDWQELTRMAEGDELVIERVRMLNRGIVIEGQFGLPPLASLTMDDQVFVAAFVKSHGSIKQMEKLFGVSYPTIKSRLNRLASRLDFIDINVAEDKPDVLDLLERGEISAAEAAERLKK